MFVDFVKDFGGPLGTAMLIIVWAVTQILNKRSLARARLESTQTKAGTDRERLALAGETRALATLERALERAAKREEDLEADIATLRVDHAKAIDSLRGTHTLEIIGLKTEHEARERELQNDLADLRGKFTLTCDLFDECKEKNVELKTLHHSGMLAFDQKIKFLEAALGEADGRLAELRFWTNRLHDLAEERNAQLTACGVRGVPPLPLLPAWIRQDDETLPPALPPADDSL